MSFKYIWFHIIKFYNHCDNDLGNICKKTLLTNFNVLFFHSCKREWEKSQLISGSRHETRYLPIKEQEFLSLLHNSKINCIFQTHHPLPIPRSQYGVCFAAFFFFLSCTRRIRYSTTLSTDWRLIDVWLRMSQQCQKEIYATNPL